MTVNVKSIFKAMTWRVIAGATTFTISYFIFEGCDNAMAKSTIVTAIDTVIKLVLYVGHEKLWNKVKLKIK